MKENKKAKKVVALLLCAVLLVVGSVTGTMAYLTSNDTVTNTFTVGNVTITLDEANTDVYGVATSGRTSDGNIYKLIPGHTYVKDPVIHFGAKSEASYLFVKVENQITSVEIDDDDDDTNGKTIHEQIIANGWTEKTGDPGIYYREVIANETDVAVDYKVFETFTLKNSANFNTFTDSNSDGTIDATITVTAYAIQKDGLDVNAAWAALNTP